METISVWLSLENYNNYLNGQEVYGWSEYNTQSPINLFVPLKNVIRVENMGLEGIEIDIKQA